MKKRVQKSDRAATSPLSACELQRVRGGATAIEYGLLLAPKDPDAGSSGRPA